MSYEGATEEEAIAAGIADAYVEFDGFNCEDVGNDCAGWDGESRRCECGNRRVYWDTFKKEDGTWEAVATAY